MKPNPTIPPPESNNVPDSDGKGVVSAATGSAQLLSEMALGHLKSVWFDLHAQRSELKAIVAATRRAWLVEGKKTPIMVRADLTAELANIRAEIAAVELEIQRRQKDEVQFKQIGKLDFWHWSDQMLAAVTFLLEVEGRSDVVKKAKQLVSKGWPNNHE